MSQRSHRWLTLLDNEAYLARYDMAVIVQNEIPVAFENACVARIDKNSRST